jgi:polyphenol oxidase
MRAKTKTRKTKSVAAKRHVHGATAVAAGASVPSVPKGWKWRRKNGVRILVADSFLKVPWLVHGFSTRSGGASKLGREAALNLGFTEWDSRDVVEENRRRFAAALGAKSMTTVALKQIHSDLMHRADRAPDGVLQGDALITRTPGLLLAVQTADCVPILLADRRQRAVAAIHAGWRGTLARIAAKTLGQMRMEFGTKPTDVIAAIGPSIGACSYEVGAEVVQKFAAQFADARSWFDGPYDRLLSSDAPNPLKWLSMMPPGHDPPLPTAQLDLIAANRWQLADAGVPEANISAADLCTACNLGVFFSYRREKEKTGRLMAAIGF